MRVTVTGSSGFLGVHLIQRLLSEGHEVTELRRTPSEQPTTTRIVQGDITEYNRVVEAVKGAEVVYHLAGVLYRPDLPESLFWQTHVGGTDNVLRAIQTEADGALLVHCSTTGVFGDISRGQGSLPDEDAPHHPTNPYESTKSQAEKAVLLAHQLGRVRATVIRPGLVYGPGDLHLLGLFRMIKKGWFRLIGPGDNLFHPIFIDEMTTAFQLAASSSQAQGRAYNIAGAAPVTFREFCNAISLQLTGQPVPGPSIPLGLAKAIGWTLEYTPGVGLAKAPLTRSRVQFLTSQRAYRVERARQELGFVAGLDLKEGVRHTVEWYQANGLL
jgi:nucleoside-diphosphate-sugar epimerase